MFLRIDCFFSSIKDANLRLFSSIEKMCFHVETKLHSVIFTACSIDERRTHNISEEKRYIYTQMCSVHL